MPLLLDTVTLRLTRCDLHETEERLLRRTLIIFVSIMLSTSMLMGCAYKYTFRTGLEPTLDPGVKEWRHIGIWGYVEAKPFDLEEACPQGVAEFGSYVSFSNWLCTFFTVGLYSPRTVYAIPAAKEGKDDE